MNYTFQFGDVFRFWPLLVQGILATLAFTIGAMTLSLVIGTSAALTRRSRVKLLRVTAAGYVEVIRNTPALVQLFILFFGLPSLGVRLDSNVAALIGLGIYNGAFVTEIVRSGIQSIHQSQFEAGLSIGMSRAQVFFYIVARPALEKIYPALSGQFVLLMLGTSIVSAIGAEELTSYAGQIQSTNFRALEVYVTCTLIYLSLALILRFSLQQLGRGLFSYRRMSITPDRRAL